MTIQNVLDHVDRYVVNQVDEDTKIHWLSQLDHTVAITILKNKKSEGMTPPALRMYKQVPAEFEEYTGEDKDVELLIHEPFTQIYYYYLEMQIHGLNQEHDRYNVAAAKYNSAMMEYMDFVNRTNMPRQPKKRWY